MACPKHLFALLLALAGAACSRTPDAAPRCTAPVLPAKFEDVLVYPAVEQDHAALQDGEYRTQRRSYPGHRAPFTMVLVPGDPTRGIAPFYIGETEVAWELFRDWACWHDISLAEASKEQMENLRPSNPEPEYGFIGSIQGENYPALGMSRLTAEKFCDFLSKRTGRSYRLPTEAEWERVHALGGGDPAGGEAKQAAAWCKENAELLSESYEPAPGKIATKKPNALGLYDMLGNAAEWVDTGPIRGSRQTDDAGDGTVVRGGSFLTPVVDLKGACRGVAEQTHWNATYPDTPKSIWWYKDHYQVGFRLACDPVNLPERKP